jgi:three-Cys-motif partner protein
MPESSVGPWAKEKLDCLGRYLHEYTRILRKQPGFRYVYVDAFSGSGIYRIHGHTRKDTDQLDLSDVTQHLFENPEHQEYIKGSPRVALAIEHPFSTYVFVEADPQRVKLLKNIQADYPDRDIKVREHDCNEYIARTLLDSRRSWAKLRAVVFLDPFGMQVPWRTIERLASTKAIEVFVNFPVGMAVQRLLPRDGMFTPRQRTKLDQYFGSAEWFDVVYHRDSGLFGGLMTTKVPDSNVALTQWYQRRLRQRFGYVSPARLIRSSSNRPLYYLIHAGPNKTGARIAKHILSQGETISLPNVNS